MTDCPGARSLRVVLGDFNWAGSHWQSLAAHAGLRVWRHLARAHQHQGVLPQLDRVYTNLHPARCLGERVGVLVREEGPELSTHRAVMREHRSPWLLLVWCVTSRSLAWFGLCVGFPLCSHRSP